MDEAGKVFQEIIKLLINRTICGIGYVVLPSDVNPGDYVRTCFADEKVSILLEGGGSIYKDCAISLPALRDVEFPERTGELGSQVVFVMHSGHNAPIIIAVISKRDQKATLGHKEFKLEKTSGRNRVSIHGEAKRGNLFVRVESIDKNQGNILIKVLQRQGRGSCRIEVQGDIVLFSNNILFRSRNTSFYANDEISLKSGDRVEVLAEKRAVIDGGEKAVIDAKKVYLGDEDKADNPVVLGEELKDILESIIDEMAGLMVLMGQVTLSVDPVSQASIRLIKTRLKGILSEKVKTE